MPSYLNKQEEKTMKQLGYVYPKMGIRMQELQEPEIKSPTEVKIRIAYCAICGSDIHITNGAFDYMLEGMPEGMIMPLGHEASGIVVETGEGCTTVKTGDRVTYNNNRPCGKCYYCRNRMENLCRSQTSVLGGMGEYVVVEEDQIYHLPDDVSLREGCLTEPVSIAMRAIQKADIRPGQSVAVIGGGPIGMLVLQLAKHAGAYPLVLLDVVPEKLGMACKLGADHSFDSSAEDVQELARAVNEGRGYDTVIECSGARPGLDTGYKLAGVGGTLVIASVYKGGTFYEIDMNTIYNRELTIKSAVLSPGLFDRSVRVLHRIDFENTVTGIYPLEKYEEAFEAHRSGKHIKILLEMKGD